MMLNKNWIEIDYKNWSKLVCNISKKMKLDTKYIISGNLGYLILYEKKNRSEIDLKSALFIIIDKSYEYKTQFNLKKNEKYRSYYNSNLINSEAINAIK